MPVSNSPYSNPPGFLFFNICKSIGFAYFAKVIYSAQTKTRKKRNPSFKDPSKVTSLCRCEKKKTEEGIDRDVSS